MKNIDKYCNMGCSLKFANTMYIFFEFRLIIEIIVTHISVSQTFVRVGPILF